MPTCSAIGCNSDATSVCGDCGIPYCSRDCQKVAWSDHKPICAILSSERVPSLTNPQSQSGVKGPTPLTTEELLREATKTIVMQNLKAANAKAEAGRMASENELFETHLNMAFSSAELAELRQDYQRARDGVARAVTAAFTAEPSADSVQIERLLDDAFDAYRSIREKITERICPESHEQLQRREATAAVELAFATLVGEANEELARGEPEVQDVDGCLDWFRDKLSRPSEDSDAKDDSLAYTRARRATTRRLLNVATKTNKDEHGFWRQLLEHAWSKFPSMGLKVVGRVALKLIGLVTVAAMVGTGYYCVYRKISPDQLFELARQGVRDIRKQVPEAKKMVDEASNLINQADAVQSDALAGQVALGRLLHQVKTESDNASETVVSTMRSLLKSALDYSESLVKADRDVGYMTAAQREAKVGTTERIQTYDQDNLELIHRYQYRLDKAFKMWELKEIAVQMEDIGMAWTHSSPQEVYMANEVYKDFLGEASSKLAGSKEVLDTVLGELNQVETNLGKGIDRMEYVRSTAPVMTAIARACGKHIGFAGNGFAVFLQLTVLAQATAVEATFGSFLNDLAASNSLLTAGAAVLGLFANIAAGFFTGQTTGFFTFMLGDIAFRGSAYLEKWAQESRSYYAESTGAGSAVGYAIWTMIYETTTTTRFWTQSFLSAVSLKGVVTMFAGVGMSLASAIVGLAITVTQLNVYITGSLAAVSVVALFYNYLCKTTPIPLGTVLARVSHFLTNYGHWFTRYAVLLIAAITMTGLYRPPDVSKGVGWLENWFTARVPTWEEVFASSHVSDATLEQITTAKHQLATVLNTAGSSSMNAAQMLGVKRLFAAGVQVSVADA